MLPIMAAIWQLSAGTVTPTWAAQNALRLQSLYFANTGAMLMNMLWRLMVILQYLVLFCLPFAFYTTYFAFPHRNQSKTASPSQQSIGQVRRVSGWRADRLYYDKHGLRPIV